MFIDAELSLPVAVAFESIEQSEPKLLKLVMLTPCSLLGVRAMMQASDELLVVVTGVEVVVLVVAVVCIATARAFIAAVGLDLLSMLKSTAPRKVTTEPEPSNPMRRHRARAAKSRRKIADSMSPLHHCVPWEAQNKF